MALPTGTIKMSDVNVELRKVSNAYITLNDADVRSLAKVPSGIISMNDLRGKSGYDFTFTVTVGYTESGPASQRYQSWGYRSGGFGAMSTSTFYGIPIDDFLFQKYQYENDKGFISSTDIDYNTYSVLSNKILDCLTTGQSFTMGYFISNRYVKINETSEWRTLIQSNVGKTLEFGFKPK